MVDLVGLHKHFIMEHLCEGDTAVDFTMGNGYDTELSGNAPVLIGGGVSSQEELLIVIVGDLNLKCRYSRSETPSRLYGIPHR